MAAPNNKRSPRAANRAVTCDALTLQTNSNAEYFAFTGQCIKRSLDKKSISITDQKSNTAYGFQVISSNDNNKVYKWIFNINKCFAVGIGLSQIFKKGIPMHINTYFDKKINIKNYSYHNNGKIFSHKNVLGKKRGKYKSNDKITMIVSLINNHKTITFYKNDQQKHSELLDINDKNQKNVFYRMAIYVAGGVFSGKSGITLTSFNITDLSKNNKLAKRSYSHNNVNVNNVAIACDDNKTDNIGNTLIQKDKIIDQMTQINTVQDKMINKKDKTIQVMQQELNALRVANIQLKNKVSSFEDDKKEMAMTIALQRNQIKTLKSRIPLDLSKFQEWDCNDVLNWILSINGRYFVKEYEQILTKEIIEQDIDGKLLPKITIDDMRSFGIIKLRDKKILEKYIKQLQQKNDDNEGIINGHVQDTNK